jgi:hypothetical protein
MKTRPTRTGGAVCIMPLLPYNGDVTVTPLLRVRHPRHLPDLAVCEVRSFIDMDTLP